MASPSSEFLYNALNIESIDNIDLSSDIKLEESSTSSLAGTKRKLYVKPEPYKLADSTECSEPPSKKLRLDHSDTKKESSNGANDSNEFSFPDLEIPDCASSDKAPLVSVTNNSNNHENNNHNNNNNNYGMIGGVSPHHPAQYLLPVVQPPHPQYFVPLVPHHHMAPHMSPYGHALPFPHHINPGYMHNAYQYHHHHRAPGCSVTIQNEKTSKKRKRSNWNRNKRNKTDENSDDTNSDVFDDEAITNNKLMADKSPFKTTYISRDEEIELKSTNSTLYSQFHHARQAIYQQYKQKTQAIRHSTVLSQEKRKLNMKMAAIDAKVQEKKLFLSYLEMSKPQPNSWLVSNTALSMNAFARKITHQTQTPSSYSNPNSNLNRNTTKLNNNTNQDKQDKENKTQESTATKQKENKPKQTSSAKRVKKPKFSEYNVRVLRDWYETHTSNPYPSSSEKHLMCQLTGLTKYQVSRWFCNVRTRKPPPELSDNDEDIIQNIKRKNASGPGIAAVSSNNANIEYNEYADYYHPPHPLYHHPSPLNFHHLQHTSPLNMPPITPIPITPMNAMNHFNFNQPLNINMRKQQNENNMMGSSNDNSEGLMPQINSEFNINQNTNNNLMPPPLIDEDSTDQT